MKPADALRLPRARLTGEQRKHIADGLTMLEGLYPQAMTRAGMSVDLSGDPVVIHEMQRHCAAEGWLAQVHPDMEPSRTHPGQMFHKGFKLILTPPPEAYADVDLFAPAGADGEARS